MIDWLILHDACSKDKDKLSLSEFSGDSEEETSTTTEFPAKFSTAEKAVAPPKDEEIEEFFAKAEKYEQKRFAEKWVLFVNVESAAICSAQGKECDPPKCAL